MTTFDEREKAFEAKYRLDQELAFKVNVRRDKLLGLWVAEQMGFSQADAAAYAKSLVEADLAEPGDQDVVRKAMKDLHAHGSSLTEGELRKQMERLLSVAKAEVQNELAAQSKN